MQSSFDNIKLTFLTSNISKSDFQKKIKSKRKTKKQQLEYIFVGLKKVKMSNVIKAKHRGGDYNLP